MLFTDVNLRPFMPDEDNLFFRLCSFACILDNDDVTYNPRIEGGKTQNQKKSL